MVVVSGCAGGGAGVPPVTGLDAPSVAYDPGGEGARVWYATAVLAAARQDAETMDRALRWVERLDLDGVWSRLARGRVLLAAGRVSEAAPLIEAGFARAPTQPDAVEALADLRAAEGRPEAIDLLMAVAEGGRAERWPEAFEAARGTGRARAVLERWQAAPAPGHQLAARARAAWEVGEVQGAADDAAAAMDWVPSPAGMALWTEVATAACRLGDPWSWVALRPVARFGSDWADPVAELASRVGDRALAASVGRDLTGPPQACPAPPVPAWAGCEDLDALREGWRADPADADRLVAFAEAALACGAWDEAERCVRLAQGVTPPHPLRRRVDAVDAALRARR